MELQAAEITTFLGTWHSNFLNNNSGLPEFSPQTNFQSLSFLENTVDSTLPQPPKKLLELINDFSKVLGHRIYI